MALCGAPLHAIIIHPETGDNIGEHDITCHLEAGHVDDGGPSDHMADHPHDDNPHPIAWPNAEAQS